MIGLGRLVANTAVAVENLNIPVTLPPFAEAEVKKGAVYR